MRWILVDVVLVLLALCLLGALLLGLWRRIQALGREVGRAGAAIERSTAELARLQDGAPSREPEPLTVAPSVPMGTRTPSRRAAGRHRDSAR